MNQDDVTQQDEQERLAQIAAQISPPNPNGPPGIALPGLQNPMPLQQEEPIQIGESGDAPRRSAPSATQQLVKAALNPGQRQQVQNSPLGQVVGAIARKMGQTPNQDISGPQAQPQQQAPGSIRGALGQVFQVPQRGQGVVRPGGIRNILDELLRKL